jgi:hypothetical protein
MKLLSCALLIVLMSFTTLHQDWKTLTKTTYSVKYPDTWTLTPGHNNEKFSLTAPSDGVGDQFVENMDLTVIALGASTYTPKQYADYSKTTLPKKIKFFKVLEEKAVKQGVAGYYMVFKGTQGADKLKWKQYYFIKSGKVYVITFTAEDSRYAEYITNIGTMLSSFTVK